MSEIKKCTECQVTKPISDFLLCVYKRNNKNGTIYIHTYRKSKCKVCLNKSIRDYRNDKYKNDPKYYINRHKLEWNKNGDNILRRRRENTKKLKVLTIKLLGGKCNNCGIDDYDLLQIDHIIPINISNKNRIYNDSRYRDVIKSPIGYQLLCANCHLKKTIKEVEKYWEMKRK